MMCAILYTYGSIGSLGDVNIGIFSFAFPALFVISGYVVLRESPNIEKRILRTIGRTALCFVILFALYLGLSFFVAKEATVALITSKTFWVDFLLLNICSLPIGSAIWFVQSLLYAYIIIYIIYKLKLLRLDIFIAVICLVVTLLTGEFASFVGFRFLGHAYLGGNFLTRALPYILIGCFISRKEMFFSNFDVRHYFLLIVAGVFLSVLEWYVLMATKKYLYVGHIFGMGIVAVGICLFTFLMVGMEIQSNVLGALSRYELMIPYFVCSPVYYFLNMLFAANPELGSLIDNFAGILTLIISFALLYVYILLHDMVMEIIGLMNNSFRHKSAKHRRK